MAKNVSIAVNTTYRYDVCVHCITPYHFVVFVVFLFYSIHLMALIKMSNQLCEQPQNK